MKSTAYDLSMLNMTSDVIPDILSESFDVFIKPQKNSGRDKTPAKKKAFINSDNQIILACPSCPAIRMMERACFMKQKGLIRMKYRCGCGQETIYTIERRRRFRKDVYLPGIYATPVVERPMIVMDLSRTGLRMETNEDVQIAVGDELWVEFCLDNPSRPFIQKKCIVQNISGNTAGVKFCVKDKPGPVDKAYDRAIGFYLFEGLKQQDVKLLPL